MTIAATGTDDTFRVGDRTFSSRLLVGTGKYRDLEQTRLAIEASGAEIVTVAIRRTNIGQTPGEPDLLDVIPPDRCFRTPPAASPRRRRSAPAGWRGNCWTGTAS